MASTVKMVTIYNSLKFGRQVRTAYFEIIGKALYVFSLRRIEKGKN